MKTKLNFRLLAALILSSALIYSCQKLELIEQDTSKGDDNSVYKTGILMESGRIAAGGVILSVPAVVNVNDNFDIVAEVSCGKVCLERGYILGPGGVKIYKDLTCETRNLLWEVVVGFQCYTNGASWNGSLSEVGTYVFRTKHNASDGNCDGLGGSNQAGNCSFSGNELYCFSIEAIDPCTTSFTGEAVNCSTQRQAIYRFTSTEDESYIKIQGGLNNFTGSDATITITGGILTSSQSTPGGSSNRIIKIEGSVSGCENITITINWSSTNTGGYITGDWSVKDANGIDIAPAVSGLTCSDERPNAIR